MQGPVRKVRQALTPVQFLIAHLSLGLIVSIAALYVFGAIAEDLVEKGSFRLDQVLATSLHDAARPALTQFLLIVTMLGMQGVIVIGVIVAIFFIVRRAWLNLLIWAIAIGGGEVLNLLLKTIFARPRPVFDVPLTVEIQFSFPSGHAMMSIITYGLLAYFAFGALQSRRWRVIIGAAMVLLVLIIGFTRLYLGAHYLTDVVGGFAAGWIWLSTCLYALSFARSRLGEQLDRSPPNAL